MPAFAAWDDEAHTIMLHTLTDPLEADDATQCMRRMFAMIAAEDHIVDVIVDRTQRKGIVPHAIRIMREEVESYAPPNYRNMVMATRDHAIRLLYSSARRVLPRIMGNLYFTTTVAEARQKIAELRAKELESQQARAGR
ncbi:MAG: hypothetical protein KF726_19625 [Anaerolineae bacterium]|nr:hypothetical protein [Anaerolineae bacterium]